MINRIIEFAVRQRTFVLLGTLVVICVGVWSALRLPIDAVPDITNVQVQINTEVPALAPEEIEQTVTLPIELEMGGLQGLVEMRSLSKFGLSQVTMIFADSTDVYRARQLVAERLQNVQENLPRGLQPKLAPVATGLGEIYFYTVDYQPGVTNKPATRYHQLQALTLVQDWTIKPALRTVPGVAEVISWGGYDKQIVVQPHPEKLRSIGLSFSDFAKRIAENLENAGGSAIEVGGENLVIRSLGRVESVAELSNVPLKFGAGVRPIQVKDVADIAISSSVRTGAASENGEEAVMGVVLMVSGENSRTVSQKVHERIGELQSKLPPGMEVRPLYNRSELVNSTIETVMRNLGEGALLVIAILFLMLGNWRAAVIVTLVIPLAMLFAMFGMNRFGISGNLMSLGAIDFGLIIDGAVVMVENIVRHLSHKQRTLGRALTGDERFEVVLKAGREVGRPMFFGVLVITIVYVPILALEGIEGKMFKPMAVVVMLALGASLVLALTLMPALASLFLKHTGKRPLGDTPAPTHDEEDATWLVRFFKRLYAPVLHFGLRSRWLVIVPMIALFAWSAWLFTRLGSEFIPQLDEGSLVIQMVRANSIALTPSLDMQLRAEKMIREEFPEIIQIYSRIGTPDVATDPMGLNLADTYLTLAPQDKWRKVNGRTLSKDELAELIQRALSAKVPGQENLFTQPIEMRFNEMLEGSRADLVVKIFGHDFPTLEKLATEVRDILAKIPGASEIAFDPAGTAPNVEIRPNREAMVRYNVHGAELNDVVSTALGGQTVGQFIEGNRRFPVVVRMDEKARRDLARIGQLPLTTDGGGIIPLESVAKVSAVERVNAVIREAGQRRAGVMVNLRGRDTAGFVAEAAAKIQQQVKFPEGYSFEFGGQFKNLLEARKRLSVILPLALALIFVLIQISFGSFRQAALICLCVPLAVTGGVIALWLRDIPFTISAAVGFIALSGIAVLNGIMLLSFINQLRQEGHSVHDAVVEGSLTRLRPKLMTALVASLGFVPMALSHGAGAEVQRPLATVVIGGIISSTFLTLVLLPTLYEWIEERNETKKLMPRPALAEPEPQTVP